MNELSIPRLIKCDQNCYMMRSRTAQETWIVATAKPAIGGARQLSCAIDEFVGPATSRYAPQGKNRRLERERLAPRDDDPDTTSLRRFSRACGSLQLCRVRCDSTYELTERAAPRTPASYQERQRPNPPIISAGIASLSKLNIDNFEAVDSPFTGERISENWPFLSHLRELNVTYLKVAFSATT